MGASLTNFEADNESQQSLNRERRWHEIYQELDKDQNGKVDIRELSRALQRNIRRSKAQSLAGKLWKKRFKKKTQDCTVDFHEFVQYVSEHEKKLAIVFKEIDTNKDGRVEAQEVKEYMCKLGIHTTDDEAERIVKKMNANGGNSVDLDAFKDYLLLHPSADPVDIARFWRHNLLYDTGDDTVAQEDFDFTKRTWWRNLLAGGIAGAISRSCTAPLDRLKIYLQVHASRNNDLRLFSGFKTLLKEGGIKSLWRGNGVNVLKIAPETALKFTFYEMVKEMMKSEDESLAIFQRLIAGSIAGACSQTIIYPMEVLKTRLALRKTGEMNQGLFKAATVIYKYEGVKAFYRGYFPNLIGIIPYAGIDLAVYETLKLLYINSHITREDPGVFVLLACGTTSSICGQCISYPLALVKTKLQALAVTKCPNQPTTMLGQFNYIVTNEGFFGLYRGITPGVMKIVPAVSISYVIYEHVRKYLGVPMA